MLFPSPAVHRGIYLANATVLLAHQVEAAYWEEWTLFRLPGGVQLFVLLNVPIIVAILIGFERLQLPSGRRLSALLAASGIFAATFHTAHLLAGDDAFRTPVSLGLLGLTALLSPLQLVALSATSAPDAPDCAPSGQPGSWRGSS